MVFKGTLAEVDTFSKLVKSIGMISNDIIISIDKDCLSSSCLYRGGGFYFYFSLNGKCFKSYSLDGDMDNIMMSTESLAKMLNLAKSGEVKIEITDKKFIMRFSDDINDFEYSAIQLAKANADYFNKDEMKMENISLDLTIDNSTIKRVIDSLTTLGDVSIKFEWDLNGLRVTSGDESLFTFSTWFNKNKIVFTNIKGKGSASFPIYQLKTFTGIMSGQKIRMCFYGKDSPVIMENVDKDKYEVRCVISPYVDAGKEK